MNLSEAVLLFIAGSFFTYVVGPIVSKYLARRSDASAAKASAAASELTLQQAAQMTVANVLVALKNQEQTNGELRKRIETLEKALDLKNEYIEALEREVAGIHELKVYVRELIEYLQTRGVEFDPPRKGLLDTDPAIKKMRKK